MDKWGPAEIQRWTANAGLSSYADALADKGGVVCFVLHLKETSVPLLRAHARLWFYVEMLHEASTSRPCILTQTERHEKTPVSAGLAGAEAARHL